MQLLDLTKAPNITDWLTAVGTVGAAAAAVWLGLRDGFTRLRVTAESSKSAAAKMYDFQDVWDTITLRIVNRGRRPAYISEFAWLVGWIPKTHRAIGDAVVRAGMPIELQDGKELAIPFMFGDQPQAFRDTMLSTGWIDRLRPASVVVRTSVGRSFRARFSRRTRRLMRERSFYRTQPAAPPRQT
jgi:hypothetical protein